MEEKGIENLRAENARLIALLASHGIDATPQPRVREPAIGAAFSVEQKIELFRRLFRGRSDVFPVRWVGKTGKSGYAPACANEWAVGLCEKPRIKCADCANRKFVPLSDQTIFDHLSGRTTVGVYPLLADDTCNFLVLDFDDAEWREDAKEFARSCRELGVPVAIEISRSGEGAHAWVFFSVSVNAREARRLGAALISFTCSRSRQLNLGSYDRMFPSQDTLPKGGFGNLIALPLQKLPRDQGRSVFVDDLLQPYVDQWQFLASISRMEPVEIDPTIFRATGGSHPLDVAFVAEEDWQEPWKPRPSSTTRIAGPLPEQISVTLADRIYVEKSLLSQSLMNRLVRLAAFQNPEFYRAQAMRLSVWDKPRVIGCAENFPRHIALPRGCLEAVTQLLGQLGIRCDLHDERNFGEPLNVRFRGALRDVQVVAHGAVMASDIGVLCAPTAFGKTVVAAALIASRAVNTLVLVHRTALLKQWRERLHAFLDIGKESIGEIGGGKQKASGRIDVAVMQSLVRKGEVDARVESYGHLVVDECHHLSAVSFEAILKHARARFVLGLTATPVRRDGQQPIIFMQCGPVRHVASSPDSSPGSLEVVPHLVASTFDTQTDIGFQDVFRKISEDELRTNQIVGEAIAMYEEGRKVLVLTERTDHLKAIHGGLSGRIPNLIALHGRVSKKERDAAITYLETLAPNEPRILVATGRLVGEGFDHPPLDSLILAMPISWKGTLQQYAGRLHRSHQGKTDIRILDFVDTGHPALMRMWAKRQVGYRAMGYRIGNAPGESHRML